MTAPADATSPTRARIAALLGDRGRDAHHLRIQRIGRRRDGARAVGDFKTTLIYADDAPSAREAEWVEAAFALNEPADILRIRRFGRNLSCKTRYLDIWSPADTR